MGYSGLISATFSIFISSLLLAACAPKRVDDEVKAEPTDEEIIAGFRGERVTLSRRRDQEDIEAPFLVEAPDTGVDLGWGWNTFKAEPIPTVCIEFVPRSIEGQTTTLSFKEVSDTYEMMRAMDISATVSVKTVGYKARGAARFAKETQFSGTSTTYVIQAEVLNGARYAGPTPPRFGATRAEDYEGAVRLTPAAADLASEDVDLFKEICGNGYISATMDGAKLTAVSSIKTSTRAEQKDLNSTISGGGGWGTKVSAALKVDTNSNEKVEKLDKEISFYQTGGKGQKLPTDATGLVERVGKLAMAADTAAQRFQVAVTPYEILENWPRIENITGEEAEFDQLAALWGGYKTLYDNIQQILNEPDGFILPIMSHCTSRGVCAFQFSPNTDPRDYEQAIEGLEDLQDEVLATLDLLELKAEQCVIKEEDCRFDAENYRTPYAIRAQMPALSNLLSGGCENADDNNTDKECSKRYIDLQIGDPAKSRCKLSSLTPGCLSNKEINEWGQRVSRRSIVERQAVIEDALGVCWGEQAIFDILWGDPGSDAKVAIWVLRGDAEIILGSIQNVVAEIEREEVDLENVQPLRCGDDGAEEDVPLVQARALHQAPTIMQAEWTLTPDDEPGLRLATSKADEVPTYYAQLAALSSEAAARGFWAGLPSAIAAMAHGLEHRLKSTSGGADDRERHLVQVGAFGSEKEVRSWCSGLLSAGIDCLPVLP